MLVISISNIDIYEFLKLLDRGKRSAAVLICHILCALVYKIVISYNYGVWISEIFRDMSYLRYFTAANYSDLHHTRLKFKCTLNKSIGMIFHHLTNLIKVPNVKYFGNSLEIP